MQKVFEPWVGSKYELGTAQGCKILILGESHYGKPADARPGFTNDIVGRYAITERRRFFSVVQRLVSLDTGRKRYSEAHKRVFWHSVAFCNYVQAIVGPKARCRPTPTMRASGAAVLLQVLDELQPEVIVVLGKQLSKHLPSLPMGIQVAYISHPSGRGMRYTQCQPLIDAAIQRARVARQLPRSMFTTGEEDPHVEFASNEVIHKAALGNVATNPDHQSLVS